MTIKESDYYVRVTAFLNVGDDPKTLWALLKDGRALLKQLMRVKKPCDEPYSQTFQTKLKTDPSHANRRG